MKIEPDCHDYTSYDNGTRGGKPFDDVVSVFDNKRYNKSPEYDQQHDHPHPEVVPEKESLLTDIGTVSYRNRYEAENETEKAQLYVSHHHRLRGVFEQFLDVDTRKTGQQTRHKDRHQTQQRLLSISICADRFLLVPVNRL